MTLVLAFIFLVCPSPSPEGNGNANPARAKAQVHFNRAEEAEKAGYWKTALAEYRLAYQAKPHADVLHNIARIEERLGDLIAAADTFDRYLAEADTVPDAAAVRRHAHGLRVTAGTRLVDEALAAQGGAGKLAALRGFRIRGKVRMTQPGHDTTMTFTRWVAGIDRARVEFDVPGVGREVQVVTPDAAWVVKRGHAIDPPRAEELDARAAFWRDKDLVLLRVRKEGGVMLAQARERGLDVVVVTRADGSMRTKLHLDPKTHLITQITAETSAGLNTGTIHKHCPYGGVKLVCHHTSSVGGGPRIEITVEELVLDPDLPASLFERPQGMGPAKP